MISSVRFSDDADSARQSRLRGAMLSGGFHLTALALFLWNPLPLAPPPRPIGANLTVVQLGDAPAAGSPEARNVAKAAPSKARPKSKAERDDFTERKTNNEDTPPRKEIALSDIPNHAPPPRSSTAPSADNDTGESKTQLVSAQDGVIAMGVRASGTAGAPDAVLAGAISAAIVNQIRACWAQPTGSIPTAPSALERRLIVVTFTPDGELSSKPTLYVMHNDQQSVVTAPDEIEQSAIDALVRCAPIKLPSALYAYWQQIELELFPGMPVPTESGNGA